LIDERLEAFRREGARFGAVVRAGDLRAPVAACPGWDLARLGRHLFWIYDNVHQIVTQNIAFDDTVEAAAPGDVDLADGIEAHHRRLVQVLSSTPPETPVWTWAGPSECSFWVRRMAAETLVHRIDAEIAVDSVTSVDAHDAADAVDEYLEWLLPVLRARNTDLGVRFTAEDVGAEWTLTGDATSEPAVVASGSAADILATIFNRPVSRALRIDGDATVLHRWLAAPAF
jgi:uncharacterized protein (TIGR03083 family)